MCDQWLGNLHHLFQYFFHGNFIQGATSDVELVVWTMVEPNIYLIVAYLVTYHPLLKEFQILTSRIRKTTLFPSSKSPRITYPSRELSSEKVSNKKSFGGFRKLRRNDLGDLGNTFDMNDTVDMGNIENFRTRDEI